MVAAMLGKPFMAWQQYVADIVLEIDPETGELAYDEYVLTVPRQSGKSTFILAKAVHRSSAAKFFGARQRIVYTAQTRAKAREKFEVDYAPDLEASRKFRNVVPRLGNGHEHIRFPNGSRWSIDANTEKAGHGGTLDEGFIDEAFAQVDNRIEQAIGPAMITRRNKQLGVISTAGWSDASPYLWGKVKIGRSLVEADVRRGTAYFEWSAPDDADPADPETWFECMPAVHRANCPPRCKAHTISVTAIRNEYDKAKRDGKISDFCRAYLNQWKPKPKPAEETAVGNWLACSTALADFTPTGVGLALSLERDFGSLGISGVLPDGREFIGAQLRIPLTGAESETVDYLIAEAARVGQQYGIPVGVVNGGPSEGLGPKIIEAGALRIEQNLATEPAEVFEAKIADYVVACADLVDKVAARTIAHMDHPELNEAVLGSRWRSVGDGRRVFGRKASETDVSMLEAVTIARKASVTHTKEAPTPWAVFA